MVARLLFIIVGALMIAAAVLLWNIGEGFAAFAFFVVLVLFGGLSVLTGLVLIAVGTVGAGRRNRPALRP